MAYYVIANKNIKKITTDSEEFAKFLGKKTCHKKFKREDEATVYLKEYSKYADSKYSAFIDLEFTCSKSFKDFKFPNIQSEVLSVGICITDNEGNIVDEFYETVKPQYNTTLTTFCKNLTHLTQEEIDNSRTLPEVLLSASKFVAKYQIRFLNSYGTSDFKQTIKDVERYKNDENYVKLRKFVNKIVNIQYNVVRCLLGIKAEISLEDAKNLCGISGEVTHNALSDAKDLSRVVFCAFFNPPSHVKASKYLKARESKIKYKSLRRFKNERFDFDEEDKKKIKEICTKIIKSNNTLDMKTQCLIDDLLYISNQEVLFNENYG